MNYVKELFIKHAKYYILCKRVQKSYRKRLENRNPLKRKNKNNLYVPMQRRYISGALTMLGTLLHAEQEE